MTTKSLVPVAQYLRMSTEHQQYSLENQSTAIQKYANSHGFEVVRTYSDAAKSGVVLRRRSGLRQLIQDAVAGTAPYQAILVYDVSRWGRFQDTDESAHYEFLCKSAGVPVHYCAETFTNDGTLASLIMKALKRIMAGEYSRELGVKVFAGQKKLAELGFKQGGRPGYGYRRLLVSKDRQPKQVLAHGERKSIATDRVVLAPGPPFEVEVVREIFRMFIVEKMGVRTITRELNRRGIPPQVRGRWWPSVVAQMLSHPKYTGSNVFGRFAMKLGTAPAAVPESEWIVSQGSHDAIIDAKTFARAQKRLANLRAYRTDDQILQGLRQLLASKGRLTSKIIEEAPGVTSVPTLTHRFGSLVRAYELVGYKWKRPIRKSNDQILQDLRSLLASEGSLSRRIIDRAPGMASSAAIKWRFGKVSAAYKLIGYGPEEK